jgi:hypothetical protein
MTKKTKPWPKWIPSHLSDAKKWGLVRDEREAVKEAMRKAEFRLPKMPATKSIEERRSAVEVHMRASGEAKARVRATAREDYRASVLADIAQDAKAKVTLPAHVTRIARGSVTDFFEGEKEQTDTRMKITGE